MITEKVTVGQKSASKNALRQMSSGSLKSRRKFLPYFPGGFYDETYIDWERTTNGKRISNGKNFSIETN